MSRIAGAIGGALARGACGALVWRGASGSQFASFAVCVIRSFQGEVVFSKYSAAIFTVVCTLTAAVCVGAFVLGYDFGAKDLATVSDFKKLDLPKLTESLQSAAADIKDRAILMDENQRLTGQVKAKDAEVVRLTVDAAGQKDDLTAARKRIADLESQMANFLPKQVLSVDVDEGKAASVIPNLLTIGVPSLYQTFADVRINGTQFAMSSGDHQDLDVGPRKCRVELIKMKPQAKFSVSCSTR